MTSTGSSIGMALPGEQSGKSREMGPVPSPFFSLLRNTPVTQARHGLARGARRETMFYRSERLFLRPAFPEDARGIYEGICAAGVVQMLASVPWPYRLADADEFCAMPHDPRAPRFVITLPEAKGAPIIGVVGFHMRD